MEKLKLNYAVKAEEWLEGYDLYYKLYRKKVTYFKAVLFLIPLLLFADQVWRDPYYTLGWICIIVCIGAIACIFATPKLERRNSEHALSAIRDDRYELTLTDTDITISTIIPESDAEYLDYDKEGNPIPQPEIKPTVIKLGEKGLRLEETANTYTILSKEINLVVPKSAMSAEEAEILKSAFNG